AGSFASHVKASAQLAVRIPDHMKFSEAASVPVAFLTAHLALFETGRLQTGERILIHAAAGGVGLAAVQLAMARGAQVFATAGSESKRAFLRSLGVAHVMNSRTLEFGEE